MRSAGCAYNDRADRRLDAAVRRTADRPLAAGELSARTALIVAIVLISVSAGLVMLLGVRVALTAALSLPVALLYPYVKRSSNYPQLVLGIAFAWGVPVAWVAATGTLTVATALLFVGTWCWIVAYDTQYAMCDRCDDLAAGVGSTAIGFGPHERLVIVLLQAATLLCWWWGGQAAGAAAVLGGQGFFFLSLYVAAALFAYQAWIVRHRQPQACLRAFNSNALIGAIVCGGAVLDVLQP